MAVPKVWTERIAGQTRYNLCTWATIEMLCVGAGNTKWPLGVYTDAELLAFNGGSTVFNFSGGVAAAKSRYGITIQSPTPYSQSQLLAALNIPGRVYGIAGKLANYPAGHARRRWAPTFEGFHAVAVVTLGGGKAIWLDPMAPMRFAGDTIDIIEVANTFALGNYPNDARYVEGGDMTTIVNATQFLGLDGKPAVRTVSFKPGTYTAYRLDGTTKPYTLAAASSASSDARCTILQSDNKAPKGSGWIRIVSGVWAGMYMVEIQPGVAVAPDPVPPPLDCSDAVADAVAPLNAEIAALNADVADWEAWYTEKFGDHP